LKPFTEEPYQFDAAYIERLAAGDPAICDHFAEYFTRVLDVMLAVRGWERERAHDIRQKTLLQVLINLHRSGSIEAPDRFGAYVIGVFRNKLREEVRDRIKHPQAPEIEPEGHTVTAEDEFVTARNKEQTAAVLNEMPERDRRVIELIYLQELEREEACRQLGVDRVWLRVRLHRAAARFRERYLKRYGSPP